MKKAPVVLSGNLEACQRLLPVLERVLPGNTVRLLEYDDRNPGEPMAVNVGVVYLCEDKMAPHKAPLTDILHGALVQPHFSGIDGIIVLVCCAHEGKAYRDIEGYAGSVRRGSKMPVASVAMTVVELGPHLVLGKEALEAFTKFISEVAAIKGDL